MAPAARKKKSTERKVHCVAGVADGWSGELASLAERLVLLASLLGGGAAVFASFLARANEPEPWISNPRFTCGVTLPATSTLTFLSIGSFAGASTEASSGTRRIESGATSSTCAVRTVARRLILSCPL